MAGEPGATRSGPRHGQATRARPTAFPAAAPSRSPQPLPRCDNPLTPKLLQQSGLSLSHLVSRWLFLLVRGGTCRRPLPNHRLGSRLTPRHGCTVRHLEPVHQSTPVCYSPPSHHSAPMYYSAPVHHLVHMRHPTPVRHSATGSTGSRDPLAISSDHANSSSYHFLIDKSSQSRHESGQNR
jgi:hypothetical protein